MPTDMPAPSIEPQGADDQPGLQTGKIGDEDPVGDRNTTPGGFELVPVATGLTQGVAFAFAPGDRIFLAEKRGVVRLFRDGQLRAVPFVDISADVNAALDRGLLGIAVHPGFPAQPYVYLLYTYDPPEVASGVGDAGPDGNGARVSRLVRVEADAASDFATARPGSEVVLLGQDSVFANIGNPSLRNDYEHPSCGTHGSYVRDCLASDENSHSIGTVAFGPDGALYVGNGDGCDYTRAQPVCTRALDLDSLSGKILRIDPLTGLARPDNPFVTDDLTSNRSKVYQLGLRNPFRFVFADANDKTVGSQLFVGDVGWNTWEEINRGGPGANFGWPCYEGGNGINLEQPSYRDLPRCGELASSGAVVTPGLFSYTHENNMGSSVLVGDVYRGASYPPLYRGTLFYTDYNKSEIRFIAFDRNGQVASSQLVVGPVGYLTQISREPSTGELYVMQIGSEGPSSISALFRLVFKGYGPGPVPGDYTVETTAQAGSCVEAVAPVADLSVHTEGLETRPCLGQPQQRFSMVNVGGDSYVLRADASTRRWTADTSDTGTGTVQLEEAHGGAAQRFRVYPLGAGFQLIGESSELCVSTVRAATSTSLAMRSCDDVPEQIFRLTLTSNRAPTIDAMPAQTGTLGQSVQIALAATDPDGQELTFFASGLPDSLSIDPQRGIVMGELTKPGSFSVTVRASDGQLEATTSFVWTVLDNLLPDVTITAPAEGRRYTPGEVVQFAGSAIDHNGAVLPAYRLSWELIAHHNEHIHFGGLPPTLGDGGELSIEDHGDNNSLELCLSATDGQGRVAKTCRLLLPREVEYTIDSSPSGLTVVWEGVARETPFTVQTHVHGTRDITAPQTQLQQQTKLTFTGWSDGGEATHRLTIGSEPTRLVASYADASALAR